MRNFFYNELCSTVYDIVAICGILKRKAKLKFIKIIKLEKPLISICTSNGMTECLRYITSIKDFCIDLSCKTNTYK